MAGFLYYLPGRESLSLKEARAPREDEEARGAGFAYAMEGQEIFARGVAHGPAGAPRGVVFADPQRIDQGRIGFFPERQTWMSYPGRPGVFVGIDKEKPPEPADLARKAQLDGHWVELADGRKWLAPVARGQSIDDDSLGWYCALPVQLTIDDDGAWTRGDVLPHYAELWRRALAFWDVFAAEVLGADPPEHEMSDDELSDLALFCLSTNYAIGKAELRLLGLFDVEARSRVLIALVDWPTLQSWMKKKRPAEDAG